ncbi:unnamed protein product [Musa acuminata subsp. malaccensis]|uniref:(wild Malaysian banana) hypothetical protein n=1 Tax=Musa acuminata subsp. malaccensis TaxID=214687 RepID=A0A804L223_MUSAM|nr:unnamed protein product [Musa acuminata subsp. malaccensis]
MFSVLSFSLRLPQFSLFSVKAALLLLSILTTVFNLHTVTCYFFKVCSWQDADRLFGG